MSPLGRFLWRWRRTAWWDGYYQSWGDAEGAERRLADRAERLRLYDSPGTTTRTSQALAADCTCTPCPGRGNDGECCFGSGIEDADPACPVVPHRSFAALSAAPADPPGREQDARETLAAEVEGLRRLILAGDGATVSREAVADLLTRALARAALLPSPPATTGAPMNDIAKRTALAERLEKAEALIVLLRESRSREQLRAMAAESDRDVEVQRARELLDAERVITADERREADRLRAALDAEVSP